MDHLRHTSSQLTAEQEKLRSSSLHQFTARDAILTAALGGRLMNRFPSNLNALGLPSGPLVCNSGEPFPGLLGSAGIGHQAIVPGVMGANSVIPIGSNLGLLDAVERRRLDLERVQAIRQHALVLTDENPFGSNQASLRALLGNQHPPVVTPSARDSTGTTLTALGNSIRKKNSPYIDASTISDPHPTDLSRRRTRGGVTEPFPEKLHRMLKEVEEAGDSDIISFFSHGRAFGVHDPERFISIVMPKYFKQSRLSSFQRQLNLYGFTRISSGPDTGGYYHELFLKGRPALCIHMRRVGVPQGEDRRKLKSGVKKTEPDFYVMKAVVPSTQPNA